MCVRTYINVHTCTYLESSVPLRNHYEEELAETRESQFPCCMTICFMYIHMYTHSIYVCVYVCVNVWKSWQNFGEISVQAHSQFNAPPL